VSAQTSCTGIDDAQLRLACYDEAAGRIRPALAPAPASTANSAGVTATASAPAQPTPKLQAADSMAQQWDLAADRRGINFELRRYKPVYILPVSATTSVNQAPYRNIVPTTAIPAGGQLLQPVEAKFQISLKSRLLSDVMGTGADVWAGYTQSSRWQVYNAATSRPFRETNYEPELIVAMPASYEVFGWQGRVTTVSLTHQSNGRSQLLSRSWNRVIADVGLERGAWALNLRPWWRLPEKEAVDNNPGIVDYVGRGELLLSHASGGNVYALQLRHSLRGGSRSRGSVQLEWAAPLSGQLHSYVQLFTGYGDSLIDYNFRQTRLGLGVSLVEWR
jgi:phospholipase A1